MSAGSAITTYVFSGFKVIAEYTGAAPTLSREYVYAGRVAHAFRG